MTPAPPNSALLEAPVRLRHFRDLWRSQSGQAMVEYSTITVGLFLASAIPLMTSFGPQFLNALNTYLGNVYAWINMPLP